MSDDRVKDVEMKTKVCSSFGLEFLATR